MLTGNAIVTRRATPGKETSERPQPLAMGEPTPTLYPYGMPCKEFTGANEGVSFTQFYFISSTCEPDVFILGITWAFICFASLGFLYTFAMLVHTMVASKKMTVPARVALYASVSLSSRVLGLLLTLYAVATPIRMYFMATPMIFLIVSGSVLEFNWLKVMSRKDWSRVDGTRGLQMDWFKISIFTFCLGFCVGLLGAWAIAVPILRESGASVRTINIAVWAGFVWLTVWLWIFLGLSIISLRKLSDGLSDLVHRAETSGTGDAPDAIVSLLRKLKIGGWLLFIMVTISSLSLTGMVVVVAMKDFNADYTLLWIYFGLIFGEIPANVAFVYMGVRRRAQFTSTSSSGSTDAKSKTAPGSTKGTHTGISKNNTELSELATMDDYLSKAKEIQSEWNEMTNQASVPPA